MTTHIFKCALACYQSDFFPLVCNQDIYKFLFNCQKVYQSLNYTAGRIAKRANLPKHCNDLAALVQRLSIECQVHKTCLKHSFLTSPDLYSALAKRFS